MPACWLMIVFIAGHSPADGLTTLSRCFTSEAACQAQMAETTKTLWRLAPRRRRQTMIGPLEEGYSPIKVNCEQVVE